MAGVGNRQFATAYSFFCSEKGMRLFELFEAKPAKKLVVKASPPRNLVAKNAQKSGAGAHEPKKFTRKEKHRTQLDEK